jgi:predicted DNA-binding protein
MKENKEKIEFWLHSNQKNALKLISKDTGYTVSELMRRGVEHIIKDLMPHLMSHNQMGVPFKKEDKNVPD